MEPEPLFDLFESQPHPNLSDSEESDSDNDNDDDEEGGRALRDSDRPLHQWATEFVSIGLCAVPVTGTAIISTGGRQNSISDADLRKERKTPKMGEIDDFFGRGSGNLPFGPLRHHQLGSARTKTANLANIWCRQKMGGSRNF
ncbi:hypothetical protein B0H10DRAFT_2203483 [Mycena sp. CBHHK59/15]|nr:hypothetical protein B0H10DRAFT_2203483 [Mycena sp. CBHHK59/15]